jgi:hypothetical protein
VKGPQCCDRDEAKKVCIFTLEHFRTASIDLSTATCGYGSCIRLGGPRVEAPAWIDGKLLKELQEKRPIIQRKVGTQGRATSK